LQTFFHDCWYWKCWVCIQIFFHSLLNALNDCEQQCNNIGLQCNKLELGSKCFVIPIFLYIPSFHKYAPNFLHLHPCNMQLTTHYWFEVTHLEINTWFLSIVTMFIDDWCSPCIELNFECMF
jgi:hypothetical protein